MRLLLDTHLLLWAAGYDRQSLERRAADAYALINDPANAPLFSVVSLWEIVIKTGTGRMDFAIDAKPLRRGLLDNGWEEVTIQSAHAFAVAALPPLHKDPFDRLLIAQAGVEGATLLTSDAQVADYPGPIRKV